MNNKALISLISCLKHVLLGLLSSGPPVDIPLMSKFNEKQSRFFSALCSLWVVKINCLMLWQALVVSMSYSCHHEQNDHMDFVSDRFSMWSRLKRQIRFTKRIDFASYFCTMEFEKNSLVLVRFLNSPLSRYRVLLIHELAQLNRSSLKAIQKHYNKNIIKAHLWHLGSFCI